MTVADFIEPPLVAAMVTGVEEETGTVVRLNVSLVAPGGTVMLDGTAATDGLLEVRYTVTPPEYAGPMSVTVPRTGSPPTVVFGERLKDARV